MGDLLFLDLLSDEIRSVIDAAGFGLVICDMKQNVLYMNHHFMNLHGYENEVELRKERPDFKCNDVWVKKLLNDIIDGKLIYSQETWHTHRDGHVFPLEINGKVIKGASGKEYIMLTALNLYDEKAYSRLNSKYNNLLMLLRGLSHELKNPIAAFKGVIEILLAKGKEMKWEDARRFLYRASESVDAAIVCLHSLGIIQTNIDTAVKTEIDLGNFLSKIVDVVLLFMDVKRVEHIFFNRDDFNGVKIWANPDEFYHIMSNLIVNAAQACLKKQDSAISIFRKPNGKNEIVFGVADNGCGIINDVAEKIFKREITNKTGGVGIGLIMVGTLCRKNDIEVSFTTEVDKGTKFFLKTKICKSL